VSLWTQNHSGAIVFSPGTPSQGDFDSLGDNAPEQAHFFLAACSQSPLAEGRAFAWAPESGNVLRARERHIALLESELAKKDAWLSRTLAEHAALQASHEQLLAELERSNEWAAALDADIKKAGTAIANLQKELETTHARYQERGRSLEEELRIVSTGYREKVRGLEEELRDTSAGYREIVHELEGEAARRLDWVRDLEEQIRQGREQIDRMERELAERTQWALSLQNRLSRSEAQLHLAGRSKWVRLGRRLHLGPEIVTGDGQPE
jgi:chromosome segregation ATPase